MVRRSVQPGWPWAVKVPAATTGLLVPGVTSEVHVQDGAEHDCLQSCMRLQTRCMGVVITISFCCLTLWYDIISTIIMLCYH